MTTMLRCLVTVGLLVVLGPGVAAQTAPRGPDRPVVRPAPGRGGANVLDSLSNEEAYRLLDAFVMSRAQAVLQLNDAQYADFFQRMRRLQTLQRQHRRQRMRILNELRQLVGPRGGSGEDEAAVVAKTKELDELEAARGEDERQALAAIDEVLQPRQRGQFRIFLENIERQKLELLLRARQGRGN